jgi:DNA-directed RNA polymerase specialized sigma24 family protein
MNPARQLEIASAVLDANPELFASWRARPSKPPQKAVLRKGHLSPEERADLIRLYGEGYTPTELAAHFRIDIRTVARIRAKAKATAAHAAETS